MRDRVPDGNTSAAQVGPALPTKAAPARELPSVGEADVVRNGGGTVSGRDHARQAISCGEQVGSVSTRRDFPDSGRKERGVYEVILTFRPNFEEVAATCCATEEQAQVVAQILSVDHRAQVFRVWVRRVREANAGS
jgi:hypothetical protein